MQGATIIKRTCEVDQMRLSVIVVAWLWALSLGVSAADCQPSEWGPDDQIGAANRVTEARTRAAATLVKKGASHPLGIVISPGMPSYPPRYTALQVVQPSLQF